MGVKSGPEVDSDHYSLVMEKATEKINTKQKVVKKALEKKLKAPSSGQGNRK